MERAGEEKRTKSPELAFLLLIAFQPFAKGIAIHVEGGGETCGAIVKVREESCEEPAFEIIVEAVVVDSGLFEPGRDPCMKSIVQPAVDSGRIRSDAQGRGELRRLEQCTGGLGSGVFQHVTQFAHMARPVVIAKSCQCLRSELQISVRGDPAEEVMRESWKTVIMNWELP